MSRATKNEKMQMVRLAATIQNLHGIASDPTAPEEIATETAGQLGMTMLKHIELIVQALKDAGK
jgi:hypothetical protein